MGGRGVCSLTWPKNGPLPCAFFLVLLALLGASFEARSEGLPETASPDGNCSVPADTQRWTKQEIFVWERVCAGDIADFDEGTADGEKLDPNGPEGLPESRILSSKFLETILLEDKYRAVLPRRGVRIEGARFTERVDLVNAELKHELWLNRCLLEQGADFSGAKSTHLLSFDRSKVNHEFTANWSRIDESLNMRDAGFADIAMESAHIGGMLRLDRSTVTGKLDLDELHVDSSLVMSDARVADIAMESAHIGGMLRLDRSTVTGKLDLDKLHVDSSLVMSDAHFGEVALESAHIGGTLELNGSTVSGKLHLDQLHVDSSLFMRNARFGDISLVGAHIAGVLSLSRSKVSGELNMATLKVDSDLHMSNAQFAGIVFRSAQISGVLALEGSTVSKLLNMDKLHVDSSLFMRNNAQFADVNLTSAHIGGQLSMVHAKVTGKLQCYNLTVDQDTFLSDAHFTVEIDCRFSKFKNLDLTKSTFGDDVNLGSAQISGELELGSAGQHSAQWSPGKTLILRNARAETIPMLTDAWPAGFDVRGFSYRALREDPAGSHHPATECRSDLFQCWFGKQKSFSPQPYEQLALVFQNQGRDDDARAIRYAGQERERSESRGFRYAWLTTLNWAIGYGHYIEWALVWTIVLVGLGALVLGISGEGPKHGLPVGISYSFDMLLPVIKLRDAHYQIDLAGWPRYYFYVHKVAGFVLASFLVAGISGLTK
jgi:cytoskeletal protein CcmA (bactofilin family)